MRAKSYICLILLILIAVPGLAAAESTGKADLQELIDLALAANPDLQAADARWRMNQEKVPQAESLEDPVLSLALNNYPVDTLEGDRTPMTGRVLRLSQKFPFPGKLALRGEIAQQQAEWYRASYHDARLQLARMVKEAYYNLYFYDRAIRVIERNIALLDDFIRLTETKYKVGTGLQQDVLKAQVERSKLMDRLFTLRQQRQSTQANLNSLLDRPTGTPIPLPEDLEKQTVEMPLEELQEKSRTERPMYAAYSSLVDKFQAEKQLAKKNFLPDFNVGAAYTVRRENMVDDGTDFVGLEFSLNLPVYRQKRHAAVAEAESGERMAMQQYFNFRNQVHFRIHDAYVRMEKNRDLVRLYRTGIIPQANQSYQAALSAYQVGKVDFLSLLDSLLTLYRYEVEYYRVFSDYEGDIARLEGESGVDIGAPAAAGTPINR